MRDPGADPDDAAAADDPFRPIAAPGAPPGRPAAPLAASLISDPRVVGRIVAGLLSSLGRPLEAAELDRANAGLARLARPPLAESDFVAATPEEVAGLVPTGLRRGLVALLFELAGDEPIRQRLATAHAGLLDLPPAPAPAAAAPPGNSVLRWIVGSLPRHHRLATEEEPMDGPYRGNVADPLALTEPPRERTPLRQQVARIREEYLGVVARVEEVIVGKREVVERVLTALTARGHVLLVDQPGVGKTQLCKAIAAAIESRFGRIQFTPDLLPLDITGANIYDPRDRQFRFRPGPVFSHLLLADEINRATPKTQSALLEVMEERSVTVDGTTHHLEPPFQVMATMNPLDHQGTYALPAAQIDRFMVMLEIGYPTPEDEVRVLDRHLAAESPLAAVRPVIGRAGFLAWQETAPLVHVSPEVKRAAVDYVNSFRREAAEQHGVSPRATIAWVRCAQARALLGGREFVTLDDLLDVAPDVLRHRLWTDAQAVRERLRAFIRPDSGPTARPAPRLRGGYQ